MFRLMVVTDRAVCRRPLVETVKAALDGGADAVQLRERGMEDADLFRLAEELRRVTRAADAALIVNRRVDIALVVEADGVQLGYSSLAVGDVRELAGDRLRIGASCHNRAELEAAKSAGADYAILGPVFPTPTKMGLIEPLGVEQFAALAHAVELHVIAIGGVTPENAARVLNAGAAGLAVIRAVLAAAAPRAASRQLADAWE